MLQTLAFFAENDAKLTAHYPIGGAISAVLSDENYYYRHALGMAAFGQLGKPDFAYCFDLLGARWMCLHAIPIDPFGAALPKLTVFRSDDGGATWTAQDFGNGPAIALDFEASWDVGFVAGANSIRVAYATDDNGYNNEDGNLMREMLLCDFDFESATWGTPFGQFFGVETRDYLLSKRTDGSYVLVSTQYVSIVDGYAGWRLVASVYSEGAWTHYNPTPEEDFAALPLLNLCVDSVGRSHVIFGKSLEVMWDVKYTQIASDGTFSAPGSLVNAITPRPSRLAVNGAVLNFALMADTEEDPPLAMWTGTPLSAPVWSSDTISLQSAGEFDAAALEWAVKRARS